MENSSQWYKCIKIVNGTIIERTTLTYAKSFEDAYINYLVNNGYSISRAKEIWDTAIVSADQSDAIVVQRGDCLSQSILVITAMS